VDIRDAHPEDWPAIWPIFRTVVEAGETYAYERGMTSDEARDLWLKMGPNRGGRGAHVGTASFMVGPAARGKGVGRALGEYVVDWHRAHGFRGIQFNAVVETNTAAVALWESLGFTIVGTVPGAFDHPTHGYVGLHVMYLSLV
jgi:GNAT superfamily N-acetyltransferase